MSQGKTYTFQRQGLENTIIWVSRGQGKSGNFFSKSCIHSVQENDYEVTVSGEQGFPQKGDPISGGDHTPLLTMALEERIHFLSY